MNPKLEQYVKKMSRASDLSRAAAVLMWDQETHMPSAGAQSRADQVATLMQMSHEFATADDVGVLLEDLATDLPGMDPDSDDAAIVRVGQRDFDRKRRVPATLIAELSHASTLGKMAWQKARADNNFAHFAPFLKQLVDLRIHWCECFAPYENRYDPLLDYFEPGLDARQIDEIFAGLKPELVKLVAEISSKAEMVDASVLEKPLDEGRQIDFSRQVTDWLGYDYTRGRLDLSAHPFTTTFSTDDVRITTRVMAHNPLKALMSSIHEAGHAMHSQNTTTAFYRTGIDVGPMMVIGESQSRFYENVIGRSRAFWRFLYPHFKRAFAPHFDEVEVGDLYRAVNQVKPGLIRVEADEVTYGLHIILRFELENDMVNERVKIDDLPREWNDRMESYLGVRPKTDSEGVLQDIHWSRGNYGYFPDYQLGSMFAVQLWDQMLKEVPTVNADVEAGRFDVIRSWLTDKVMKHGRKYTITELAPRVTGSPLQWQPYVDFIKTKFGEIYGL
jgi:carboxypeptidase Taq